MKVVTQEEANPTVMKFIDYEALAREYNRAELNGGVELDRVYNVTLFKRALGKRGLEEGADFTATNKGPVTLVLKLSNTPMSKE